MTTEKPEMPEKRQKPKPDLEHLTWAIEQRSEIQRTLLALYEYVRGHEFCRSQPYTLSLLDELIGAAFSLWRAVFLADKRRDYEAAQAGQEDFLERLITTNIITFEADKANSAWSVSYYLENAKMRILRGSVSASSNSPHPSLDEIEPLLASMGSHDVEFIRHEWESTHSALRMLFHVMYPECKLAIKPPTVPKPSGLDRLFESDEPQT
jgi:hypothetical protein